jgi:hypothetical protein
LRGGVEALLKVFGGEILGFAHQVIGSFSRRVHVSRPQRGTQVLRCRPGIVASAALVKVPALRCTAGALHRVRDTSVVSDKHIRSRAAFASELCDHHASSKTQPLARTKARGAERRKTQSNHCPPRKRGPAHEGREIAEAAANLPGRRAEQKHIVGGLQGGARRESAFDLSGSPLVFNRS